MPTIIIRNQFSFFQAWCPQWESEINSLSLKPDAHNNNQKSILFSSGLMPTMPLEREAAYNNWRKTFSDLQVKRLETPNLFDLFSMQLSYKNVSYEVENMCSEVTYIQCCRSGSWRRSGLSRCRPPSRSRAAIWAWTGVTTNRPSSQLVLLKLPRQGIFQWHVMVNILKDLMSPFLTPYKFYNVDN